MKKLLAAVIFGAMAMCVPVRATTDVDRCATATALTAGRAGQVEALVRAGFTLPESQAVVGRSWRAALFAGYFRAEDRKRRATEILGYWIFFRRHGVDTHDAFRWAKSANVSLYVRILARNATVEETRDAMAKLDSEGMQRVAFGDRYAQTTHDERTAQRDHIVGVYADHRAAGRDHRRALSLCVYGYDGLEPRSDDPSDALLREWFPEDFPRQ